MRSAARQMMLPMARKRHEDIHLPEYKRAQLAEQPYVRVLQLQSFSIPGMELKSNHLNLPLETGA